MSKFIPQEDRLDMDSAKQVDTKEIETIRVQLDKLQDEKNLLDDSYLKIIDEKFILETQLSDAIDAVACERDYLRAQLVKAKAFISDWLAFEQSCVEKDGPYVSKNIPNLMSRAELILADLTQKGPSDE